MSSSSALVGRGRSGLTTGLGDLPCEPSLRLVSAPRLDVRAHLGVDVLRGVPPCGVPLSAAGGGASMILLGSGIADGLSLSTVFFCAPSVCARKSRIQTLTLGKALEVNILAQSMPPTFGPPLAIGVPCAGFATAPEPGRFCPAGLLDAGVPGLPPVVEGVNPPGVGLDGPGED